MYEKTLSVYVFLEQFSYRWDRVLNLSNRADNVLSLIDYCIRLPLSRDWRAAIRRM